MGELKGSDATDFHATRIRDVSLQPGETVHQFFAPEQGLTQQPPPDGQLLIATNQRVLAFCQNDGRRETFLLPLDALKGVTVTSRSRRTGSLVQGALMIAAGIVLYLVVTYWLTGRFDGPSIPVINMDVAPLMVLLVALVGITQIGMHYFSKDDGKVTFQGSNSSFVFPYRGDRASREIYELVSSVFDSRRSEDGRSFSWED